MTVAPPPAAVDATGRTTTPTVCVALVTFNRKLLLLECLDALLAQTRPVDRIFIIDNGSTDGTGDLLRERGYFAQPVVTYVRMDTNSGGAGGFHRGLELGASEGFDWIWLMDDDAEPAPEALARTLAATTALTPQMDTEAAPPPQPASPSPADSPAANHTVAAVANYKVSADGIPQNAHMHLRSGETADRFAHTTAPQQLTFSSFVGLLVRRTAVERIGLPRREFFLNHDDNEYCARLLQAGQILLAPDSIIRHKEAALKGAEARSFFGLRRNRLPVRAFAFRYFAMRNELVTYGQHTGRARMLLRALTSSATQAAMVLAYRDDHPLTRLHVIAKAHADALRANFDNDFPFRLLQNL